MTTSILDLPLFDRPMSDLQFLKEIKMIMLNDSVNSIQLNKSWKKKTLAATDLFGLPFLTTEYFKNNLLPQKEQWKYVTSSGTSGHQSHILISPSDAFRQRVYLSRIVSNFIGVERQKFFYVDEENSLTASREQRSISTKEAAKLGFSIAGKRHAALPDSINELLSTLDNQSNKPFIIFGFTADVFLRLIKPLAMNRICLDSTKVTLIHGGGWKKMKDIEISNTLYRENFFKIFPSGKIHNYYGIAESLGSIFMECDFGFLHVPNICRVVIRHQRRESGKDATTGLLQILSLLPHSYPGNSILTSDRVDLYDSLECACGRFGQKLIVLGRLDSVAARGCSDV